MVALASGRAGEAAWGQGPSEIRCTLERIRAGAPAGARPRENLPRAPAVELWSPWPQRLLETPLAPHHARALGGPSLCALGGLALALALARGGSPSTQRARIGPVDMLEGGVVGADCDRGALNLGAQTIGVASSSLAVHFFSCARRDPDNYATARSRSSQGAGPKSREQNIVTRVPHSARAKTTVAGVELELSATEPVQELVEEDGGAGGDEGEPAVLALAVRGGDCPFWLVLLHALDLVETTAQVKDREIAFAFGRGEDVGARERLIRDANLLVELGSRGGGAGVERGLGRRGPCPAAPEGAWSPGAGACRFEEVWMPRKKARRSSSSGAVRRLPGEGVVGVGAGAGCEGRRVRVRQKRSLEPAGERGNDDYSVDLSEAAQPALRRHCAAQS
ncbi:hypothetical protein ACSSS7_006115 [Eimeria intestinalis]